MITLGKNTKAQHTMDELRTLQALPLDEKIQKTKTRAVEFYNEFDGNVYISFSGGKDSTVLRHIVHSVYPDVPAVYADTGLEYPEVRNFALSTGAQVVYPQIYHKDEHEWRRATFRDVIEKCGYPVISKEVSQKIKEARRKPDGRSAQKFKIGSEINQKYPTFSMERYAKYLDAPFEISDECCKFMKKMPFKLYERETGRHPITGQMANESANRKTKWLQNGCNLFDSKRPISNPMSFWTEQDVLLFLVRHHDEMLNAIHNNMYLFGASQDEIDKVIHPWALAYGEIVKGSDGKLYTTGCERTGCIFCMFGAQCDKNPTRFQRLKETHPKQYAYCMKPWAYGGLGLAEVLDYIGVEYK